MSGRNEKSAGRDGGQAGTDAPGRSGQDGRATVLTGGEKQKGKRT